MEMKLEQKVKVVVSNDLSQTIVECLTQSMYKKPMIVIDKFLVSTSPIQTLMDRLHEETIDFYLYDQVVSDPPLTIVDEGAKLFQEHACDSVIAIGGGSAIDSARGINIVRTFGGSIREYAQGKSLPSFCTGLIAVPTTSGTGSELSNALIVTEPQTNQKLAVLSNNAVSEYAVLVPKLVVTLPKNMTIATGLDTFAHAAEGYTSNLSSPIVDAICEKVLYLVVKYLPKAVHNGQDLEAREKMMVAAALGGFILNNGGTHIGHSQAHVLGSAYKIPHGMACAYALPGTLKYTAQVKRKKIKEIGYILGAQFPEDATDLEVGEIVSQRFKQFRDSTLGLPRFSEFGLSKEELLTNVEEVVNEQFAGNTPMKVDQSLVTSLLEMFG